MLDVTMLLCYVTMLLCYINITILSIYSIPLFSFRPAFWVVSAIWGVFVPKKKVERKVQVGWWVPEETVEAFRNAVFNKWGTDYRRLGEELGEAMDSHIDNHLSHEEPRTHAQKQPKKTTKSRLSKLVEYLREKYPKEPTDKAIYEGLDEIFGADDFRTFVKYRDLLLDRKLLKRDRRAPLMDFVITTPTGKKRTIPAFIYKWEGEARK